jgi:hypothetical protein
MDIDATRKKHDTPDTCWCCGKVGHWAKDCEHRFDIWYMLTEEKEEWLQNLALEVDKEEIEKREKVCWVFRTAADEGHASAAK